MQIPIRIFVLPLALILSGCAVTSLEPTSFAPRYKFMDLPTTVPKLESCAAVAGILTEDTRPGKEIGKRTLQEQPGVVQTISIAGSTTEWLRIGTEDILARSAVGMGVAGKPTLRVKLTSATMLENVFRRASYDGAVTVDVALLSPGSNAACWSTQASGDANNYGYAGSAENYEETLNHALNRALLRVLSDKQFAAKLCGGCK